MKYNLSAASWMLIATSTLQITTSFSPVTLKNPHISQHQRIYGTNDDNQWDYDEDYEDYEEDDTPKKNLDGTPNLGINLELDPLTKEQAEQLKREAAESINQAFDGRMEEIENLKGQVQKDFEKSKEAMRFASDLRAAEQTEKLMGKIDQMSNEFLSKNEELRTGTKMAARADRAMTGKGLQLGSWGKISGMDVLTTAAGGLGGAGLLGSVSAAEIDERKSVDSKTTESSIEVDTQVKQESRIMVVCDDKKDKQVKQVLDRFETILGDTFPTTITVDSYNPAAVIPMGGNNAQCCIIVSTSLSNGQSSAENILGRVLKRTLASGGGSMSKPPTHIVVVTPLGTERIEQFPYSMQNMMGGGKLKKAREVEEVAIATVKGRFIGDASTASLDYTIVKLGEIVNDDKIANGKDGVLNIQPGDVLDGKVGVEAAANTLVQAIALRPSARNATLSVVGAVDGAMDTEIWDDFFLRLDGPELWRSEELASGDVELETKFEGLASYMEQWSDRFNNGAKGTGLTTPVTVSPSRFRNEPDVPNVIRKYGVCLEFKTTATGAAYKSKSEERELEKMSGKQQKSGPPLTTLKQKKEGGIEILVEEVSKEDGKFELRVRAKRCNMDDNTVIKEMSEETILKRLNEAVEAWKKEQ